MLVWCANFFCFGIPVVSNVWFLMYPFLSVVLLSDRFLCLSLFLFLYLLLLNLGIDCFWKIPLGKIKEGKMENINLSWWISVVEIPLFVGGFWLLKNSINILEKYVKDVEAKSEKDVVNLIESLASFRVDVAVNYASISCLKDVENRLTAHLLRIEEKVSGRK